MIIIQYQKIFLTKKRETKNKYILNCSQIQMSYKQTIIRNIRWFIGHKQNILGVLSGTLKYENEHIQKLK